jgi:endo-1,4-beta-mannosidase
MKFRLGINYWPANKAMYWWRRFDPAEVQADFARIRNAGFDSVRVFLLWEDFQPRPSEVSETSLCRLVNVANAAADHRLALVVTLFTGHMSGVNWLPEWAIVRGHGTRRFRTVSDGYVVDAVPRNWYGEENIRRAQELLAREVAQCLGNHPALWSYDLGNENSNCAVPPSRASAVAWLESIASAIRSIDSYHPITIGLHAEDLEEDRRLGPLEAARVCDFLSMHGYPMYLSWAKSADDEKVLPFLGLITQWLSGREVHFQEFGAPSADPLPATSLVPMLDEDRAGLFTARALEALHAAGFPGTMVWCFADYDASLWHEPPFDQAPHERHFGLWRRGYSSKPALAAISSFAGRLRTNPATDFSWIDIPPEQFYQDPRNNLRRLYRRFRATYSQPEVHLPCC